MKRSYQAQRDAKSEKAELAAALGRLWEFAHAPENGSDSFAGDLRLLLARCSELADLVPRFEQMRADNRILSGAVVALRREHARLRDLINGAADGDL